MSGNVAFNPKREAVIGKRTRCAICKSPFVGEVNAMLGRGVPYNQISAVITEAGAGYSRQAIMRHARGCDLLVRPTVVAATARAVSIKDFAALVQSRAHELVESGELEITVRDGLAATAIIDKREEKAKDREFVLNLARLISGAGQGAPITIIDGQYSDLDEDDEIGGLLAPPELRDV